MMKSTFEPWAVVVAVGVMVPLPPEVAVTLKVVGVGGVVVEVSKNSTETV